MNEGVFGKTNLGGIDIDNRFVRSACEVGIGTADGDVTEDILDKYVELAEGKVGLIITGMMNIRKDDFFTPGDLAISDDSYIKGLKRLADTVHKKSGKIIAQLGHKGSLTFTESQKQPIGSLGVEDYATKIVAKEIGISDIKNFVETFGQATSRDKSAGFDGIQIHVAHGSLLSKVLTPYYNKRTDGYGGSIENRSRIIVEILKSIKDRCGEISQYFLK